MLVLTLLACVPASPTERAAAVAEGLEALTRMLAAADGVEVRGELDDTSLTGAQGTWVGTRSVLGQEQTTCEDGMGDTYPCTRVHLTASVLLDARLTGENWYMPGATDAERDWRDTPAIPERPADTIFEAPDGAYAHTVAACLTARGEIAGNGFALQSAWAGEVSIDEGEPVVFGAWMRKADREDVFRVALDGETREWDEQYGAR
jgi:hypothetical protein